MKKELKGFVCGVLTVSVIGACASAAGVWDKIDVLRNDIKVVVNGTEIAVDNFLYNDTTYIPLRAVSTALGEKVDYDDATGTAYIGEKPVSQTPPPMQGTTPDPMYIETEEEGVVTNDEFRFSYDKRYKTVNARDVIDKANEIVGSSTFSKLGYDIIETENYKEIFSDIPAEVPIEQYYQLLYPWLKSLL